MSLKAVWYCLPNVLLLEPYSIIFSNTTKTVYQNQLLVNRKYRTVKSRIVLIDTAAIEVGREMSLICPT